jgi:hypothetical protein
VRIVLRNAADLLAQGPHRLALAGRRSELRTRAAAQLFATTQRQRLLDGTQQLGERNGLLEEIDGAEARGFHSRVDRAVARHHDHGTAGAVLGPFFEQRDAVGVGHPNVEQNEIELALFASGARLFSVGCGRHLVAFFAQDLFDQSSNVGFVVDDQNARAHARSLL